MKHHVFLYPLEKFGLSGGLFAFDYTLFVYVLYAIGITIFLSIVFGLCLKFYSQSLTTYTIQMSGQAIGDFIADTIGFINKPAFCFISFLLFFIMVANMLVLIPHLEEPTNNLSVTLALAVFSFIMIHRVVYIEEKMHYWYHWFKMPLNFWKTFFDNPILQFFERTISGGINIIVAVLLFPIELISRSAVLLSLSFRLFGNMFAGAILAELAEGFLLSSLVYHIIGTVIGIGLFLKFFAFFEGLIQAGIFVLISLNNIAILLGDRDKSHKGNH